jgi:hypothetical protein
MGLITGVLTLPLAPVRGLVWVAERLGEEAEHELYDEHRIQAELLQLELDSEAGLIDAAAREQRENELLERLAMAAARNRERLESSDPESWHG